MSDINKQDLNSEAVPFFARYLEGQVCEELSEEEMEVVRGGDGNTTTLKYPSDQEDGGGTVMTQKFPSDQEDSGSTGFSDITIPSTQELLKRFLGAKGLTADYLINQDEGERR
jgi:hypothetical protein